jgi:hypothetical protein
LLARCEGISPASSVFEMNRDSSASRPGRQLPEFEG